MLVGRVSKSEVAQNEFILRAISRRRVLAAADLLGLATFGKPAIDQADAPAVLAEIP